ncbi:MAG TPA: DUF4249 domain-containing protein [Fulvivirga sp.]|nr:DUF4249 domain-containing protein [Fulvivirga sp.]
MKKYILLLIGMITLGACEETVQLDLKNSEPIVVVEGLVTNELKNHYIKVSKSVNFYDSNNSTKITNAMVTVTDGEDAFNYVHNPNNKDDEQGTYYSAIPYAGQVGKTYTLNVVAEGKTYTAVDILHPVANIDSLTVRFDPDEFENPEEGMEDYYYEVLFYAHEPQETKDFYLFKFYRNDTLIYDTETDIYFSDDDLLGEEINGLPTASFYKIGDMAKVEMYSISNAGFIYYNDLVNLLNNDGGMFGSPPVNPRTNITGGALGFFQASSIVMDSILVKE